MTKIDERRCDCPPAIRDQCRCRQCDCRCFDGFRRLHVIMASAGTGKTYRLAMRFVQLLCFGVDPAEILAVTFTKKAAGEIFDKIISRLLDFSENQGSSDSCCEVSQNQFIDVLRRLLKTRRELQIGTIDSFFRQLTDVYAPELGIWGNISLIDAKDVRYRRRTLRKWLRRIHDNDELEALRELLKMANRDEQKSFSATMDELIEECYPFYLAHGTDHLEWGRVPFLFGSDHESLPPDQVASLAEKLREAAEIFLAGDEKGNRVAARQLTALAELCATGAEAIGVLPSDVKKLFSYLNQTLLWEHAYGKELAVANTRSGKLKTLIPEYGDLVRKLFCHIRAVLTRQTRIRSNAVYQLMKRYDDVYHREVRSAGLLTFADIPYLLQSGGGSAFRLFANDAVNLEERLDAKLNHYLFDEFQDTSDLQWNAFDDLLDELVNDNGDRFRSFFCVGDVKQSIYRFRQGNPRLFYKVLEKARTDAEMLSLSYRSTQQVLDLVNRVFDCPQSDRGFLSIVDRLDFEKHQPHRQDAGFSALIEFQKNPDDPYDLREWEKADLILQTLAQIQPFARGLSVGILMRNNRHLREFAQILQDMIRDRKLEMSVTVDGTLAVLDSLAVELFLQLLILARHPADNSARTLLHLAHFGNEALSWEKWGERLHLGTSSDAETLSQLVRLELDADGIAGLADRFLAGFGDEFDDFDRRRFDALRRMARDFSGDPDDFRDRLKWQEEEEKSLAGSIQLMTIHKAKGLDFDLVFLPEFNSRHGGVNLKPEVDLPPPGKYVAHPRWIGYLPDAAVAETIPAASDHFSARKAEEKYDDACAAYVGLTRAKRALYLLLTTPGRDSQQPEAALVDALACDDEAAHQAQYDINEQLHLRDPGIVSVRYASGRSDFFTAIPLKTAAPAEKAARDVSALHVLTETTAFARPSAAHGRTMRPAGNCFEPAHGAETGTLIHALFEKIEFIDEFFDVDKFLEENLLPGADADEVKELFCRSLASGEIADALRRVDGDVVLWREKDFLQKTADGIVSGTFDRVVLYRENGNIVRAEILDYKSDRLATAEEFLARHALQLQIYRKALTSLTQLAPEKITCALLALRLGKKISVPCP